MPALSLVPHTSVDAWQVYRESLSFPKGAAHLRDPLPMQDTDGSGRKPVGQGGVTKTSSGFIFNNVYLT